MSEIINISLRGFLKTSAIVGGERIPTSPCLSIIRSAGWLNPLEEIPC